MFAAGIITASDSGARGDRVDESGKLLKEKLIEMGLTVSKYQVLPDDRATLKETMLQWSQGEVDLILTTGGTGLSPRDWTPEATKDVIDREIPGFGEQMRRVSMDKTPHGMLSRGVSGIKEGTIIINMPGSPKAVAECFDAIAPALIHGLEIVTGRASDCARKS